jgi:hypothetical protein
MRCKTALCVQYGKYDDKYGKYDDKYGKYDDKVRLEASVGLGTLHEAAVLCVCQTAERLKRGAGSSPVVFEPYAH